ncbi:MAG: YicC/YloC family endoribonuclease [Bacteroidota bacterium]
MISSMTGYGYGEVSDKEITATVEIRSVNSRFLEVTARLPRTLALRENDVKEVVRKKILRGKVNVVVTVKRESMMDTPLKINAAAARTYYRLLNDLRKAVKLKEKVKLEHLLRFSEVLEVDEADVSDVREWCVVGKATNRALDEMVRMRLNEGEELRKDLEVRIRQLYETIDQIEMISNGRIPEERNRMRERVRQILENGEVDEHRLELEVALLAEKLDVTEECVRFRSHNKFFLEALRNDEAAGRKLNFLVQEMNREVNTIGSKASDAAIAHLVVQMKEELERVREQLQNIE